MLPHQPPTGNGPMGGGPNHPSHRQIPSAGGPGEAAAAVPGVSGGPITGPGAAGGNGPSGPNARHHAPHMPGNMGGAGRGGFGGGAVAPPPHSASAGPGKRQDGTPYASNAFGRGIPPPAGRGHPPSVGGPPQSAGGRPTSSVPPQGGGTSFPGARPGLPSRPGANPPPSNAAAARGLPPGPGPQEDRRVPPVATGGQAPPHVPSSGAARPPQASAPPARLPFRINQPPPQPNRVPAPTGGMRELRVEDALLYLDDVKREFGDRPRIYNEFLEIMKNFKSQEVDTPGVIDRVSKLFRGYNKLILGFNKFLPDGYKISLQDLEKQDAEVARQQQLATASGQNPQGGGPAMPYYSGGAQSSQSGVRNQPTSHTQSAPGVAVSHAQQQGPSAPDGSPQPNAPLPPHNGGPPASVAGNSPAPSQSFPKRSLIGPPSHEQGGPPNRQVTAPPGSTGPARQSPVPHAAPSNGSIQQHMPSSAGPPPQQQQQHHPPQPMSHGQTQQHPSVGHLPPRPSQPAPQHQAVEFDHAISYVTNIKKRFANDPGTYHAFLEILHTYQKEQRGIKEVLEQVAALFADHPDLLKEFTFFLPDAVQEQAKERLHRAAADSEARQAAAAQRISLDQHGLQFGDSGSGRHMMPNSDFRGMRVDQARPGLQQNQPAAGETQKFIDMTRSHQMQVAEGPGIKTGDVSPSPGRHGISPTSRKRPFSPAGRDTSTPVVPIQPQQPEAFVYNSAVERQFFDAAKEALTAFSRDGGQAWAEFVKCLDMYAQEILDRNQMLNFVEPILGKRNAELFEEFKRIVAAAGSLAGPMPSMEDSWYSVPLSEIDFSRCRRCSPSYRALPRDYPAPPCGGRSEEEFKVLNDIWVSLPVGSEESYTFRHMRRNQYEEVLFRCEDERFEIDMVIDSNAATMRRLEPIAEEIAQLAQEEEITSDLAATGNGTKAASDSRVGGMGGMRYQYTFDRSILGVIQRNSISRIYGDAGPEILDLIVRNPTVAVPLVVQRLRQKDREWREARERLNRHWKDLAEMNYYKSLDHRSLTWRTTDKRATSTRTLVAEIKDRAAHGGNEGDAALLARREKAKEEHGSFYEVTMGNRFSKKLDLTFLPKPQKKLFTPHLSFLYDNNSWAQRDAYRILAFALERGATSPTDKERCHRLWRDFLGPWFGLSLNWMLRPAVSFQASRPSTEVPAAAIISNGEDSPHDDDDEESHSVDENERGKHVVTEEIRDRSKDDQDSNMLMDHHPLPVGSFVSTLFGEGRITQFRRADGMYVVSLPFGSAFLRPNAVLCTILVVEKSAYTQQLRGDYRTTLERPDDMMAIGTQSLYLFFRLHQILVRRLNIARELAFKVPHDKTLATLVEQMEVEDSGRKRYEAFLSLVYALVDGGHSIEGGGKYEDRVRCLLGHGAFELATMDKLLAHILKNLQSMGSDDTMQNLVQLFRRHMDLGSFHPDAFLQEAKHLSDGENMFAFQLCHVRNSDQRVLHIEFLGVIAESESESTSMELESTPVVATAEPPAMKRQRRHKESI